MARITGTSAGDTLKGESGDDLIEGLDGADVLDGLAGNDTHYGGDGNDTLLAGAGNDYYEGGRGFDTLSYANSPAGVSVTKPQTGSDSIVGSASDGFGGTDTLFHGTADELVGSAFDDTLTGSPVYTASWSEVFGNDVIFGGAGNDLVAGLGGNDVLNGGVGDDSLDGGDGFDNVNYEYATGGVVVNLAAGTGSGADGNDMLTGFEAIIGSFHDDTLSGSGADEGFGGLGGDDVIDGGAGVDFLWYGAATVGVFVDLEAGIATGEGTDTLAGIEAVRASPHADTLLGDGGPNELIGGGGDDSIGGREGNDVIGGRSGNDTLDGGAGIDAAAFMGARANYAIGSAGSGFVTVTDAVSTEGTDLLSNVERLQFADIGVALDLDGHAGIVAKVLGVVFDAVENEVYAGIGLELVDGGMSYGDLMGLALAVHFGGPASNADLVTLLYTHVVGSAPSVEVRDSFVELITTGGWTQVSLALFAADLMGVPAEAAGGLEYA